MVLADRFQSVSTDRHDWVSYGCGMLAGLPLSYPGAPYYWLAFLVLGICFLALCAKGGQASNRVAIWAAIAGILLCAMSIYSNVLSEYQDIIGPFRIVTSSFFYLFFLCGLAIRDHGRFFEGFVNAIAMQSVLVISASVFLFPWSKGALVLSVPELRLWGAEIFPDWPNFYAAMLSLGFIVAFTVQRRWIIGAICLAAALLTTSRTVVLAIAVVAVWWVAFSKRRSPRFWVAILACVLVLGVAATAILAAGAINSGLSERLFLVSDRLAIFSSSLEIMQRSPVLGVGGVLLDSSIGHTGAASFHNSYMEVAVRMGILGLIIYVPLVLSPLFFARWSEPLTPVIWFLLAGSLFQNLLRHPHIAIVLAVAMAWMGARRALARRGRAEDSSLPAFGGFAVAAGHNIRPKSNLHVGPVEGR